MDRKKTDSLERSGPSVLLVSDDRGTAIVLRALLEQLGATVHVARNAHEAQPMFNAQIRWVVMDPSLDAQSRLMLMNHGRTMRRDVEFIVMAEMRDIEGVLEVMGYSMAN